jgi:hypothetical protein
MKTLNNTRLDLRKFPKSVRLAVNSRKNEINNVLYEDIKTLFSNDVIVKGDFIKLFEKHATIFLVSGSIAIDKIRFKGDNTPDLRSLPKNVREIFKTFNKSAEQKKVDAITEMLNVETITDEDLVSIQQLANTNFFKQKWSLA